MTFVVVLPVALPLVTATVTLAARKDERVVRASATAGAVGLLGAAVALLVLVAREGIQATQVGDWRAPFGISFVADTLAAVMVLVAAILALAGVLYSQAFVDDRRVKGGYFPLLNVMLAGVCGAFLTGDLFNLYVWFEVLLVASFALLAMGGRRAELEGAVKYAVLSVIGSGFFLAGVGVLYGMSGTLNMADLHERVSAMPEPRMATPAAALLLVAFGLKAAVFPLFSWLPASYPAAPPPVGALFAGLLTKVGVYAMMRMFTLVFVHDRAFTHEILLWVSVVTMLVGVLGAVAQVEMLRLLSFHIISQIGYMTLGIALSGVAGLAGALFYVIHNIFAKSNLFLVSGIVHRARTTFDLKALGGLARQDPLLAAAFLVPALSLAGVPPLSGFFAKVLVVRAAFAQGRPVAGAVALLVGLLTLFSMNKIWQLAFWGHVPDDAQRRARTWRRPRGLYAPVLGLASVTLLIGLAPGLLYALTEQAAHELTDPAEYVAAVMGAR